MRIIFATETTNHAAWDKNGWAPVLSRGADCIPEKMEKAYM